MTWPEVPWTVLGTITIVANGAIPVAFYPVSKTLWLAWHPLEEREIEAAAARTFRPST